MNADKKLVFNLRLSAFICGPHCFLVWLAVAAVAFGQIQAGAGKAVITPDLAKGPVYMAGFGRNRIATTIHDELFARCLAVAANEVLVFCGVDSIGLFWEDTWAIREKVRAAFHPTVVKFAIAAAHNHETPDTMGLWGPAPGKSGLDEAYNQLVIARVSQAAIEAVKSLRPAVARLATVRHAVLDGFIHDTRPPVVHDSDLIVASFAERSGKAIGTIVNWANHPETLGSKNTEITADFPGFLYRELERRLGGTAVFLNGAVGGMQSPLGAKIVDPKTGKPAPEDSFRKAEIIGTRVAELAASAIRKAATAAVDAVWHRETPLPIHIANPGFQLAAKAGLFQGRKPIQENGLGKTAVAAFRFSHRGRPVLEGVLVPGELYPELSVGGVERYPGADFPDAPAEPAIKSLMTAPHRMLIGLANDEIGYIIPKAEWDEKEPWLQNAAKRWYGEVNATGPDAAPMIVKAVQELLRSR